MSVTVSPTGLAAAPTANQLSAMASYREKLCIPACSNMAAASSLPVSIQYTYGPPILSGSTVFVPITATITIPRWGSCQNNPQRIIEQFDVAFQGQTAVPESVDINSVGRLVHAQGKCILINDSITVALVAAAAA